MRYQISTVQHSHRPGPRLAAVALSVCCFVLSAGVAVGQPVPSSKAAAPRGVFPHGTAVDKYLGMWNYDEPDLRTMTDIAVITCPPAEKSCAASPPLELPQIGFVVFSPGPHGSVVGRTDQGCTRRTSHGSPCSSHLGRRNSGDPRRRRRRDFADRYPLPDVPGARDMTLRASFAPLGPGRVQSPPPALFSWSGCQQGRYQLSGLPP